MANITNLKKLRCKKQYGTWYYEKTYDEGDKDFPLYYLYDEQGNEVNITFPYYQGMKDYIETGEVMF